LKNKIILRKMNINLKMIKT